MCRNVWNDRILGGGDGGRETGGGGKECRCHAPAASLALREDQRMR